MRLASIWVYGVVSNVLYGKVEEQGYYVTLGRVGEKYDSIMQCCGSGWLDPDLDPYYLSKVNTIT